MGVHRYCAEVIDVNQKEYGGKPNGSSDTRGVSLNRCVCDVLAGFYYHSTMVPRNIMTTTLRWEFATCRVFLLL